MAIYVIPMSVFANDNTTTDVQVTDSTAPKEETETWTPEEEPYVLGEVESLRTVTAKTFRLSNGNFAAVEYGQNVHFKENEQWQDYDNTLAFESVETAKTDNNINIDVSNNNLSYVGIWPCDPMYFWENVCEWNPTDPRWTEIARIGKGIGLNWGGDFSGNYDCPHFYIW
jgi:hypothetical protein